MKYRYAIDSRFASMPATLLTKTGNHAALPDSLTHPPDFRRPPARLRGRRAAPELQGCLGGNGADPIRGEPPDPGTGRGSGREPFPAPHPRCGVDQRRLAVTPGGDPGPASHRRRGAADSPDGGAPGSGAHHLRLLRLDV